MGIKTARFFPSQLLALSKVALFILLSGMICQVTGGLGSWGEVGNVPPTSHCFLLKWYQIYGKSSCRSTLGKNLKDEWRDILFNVFENWVGKRVVHKRKKTEKKGKKTYEKELKEAKQEVMLFIMLLQILCICRWPVLANIWYCTCSAYTPDIITKGKFGGCGIIWLRKAKNSHQKTGESQKIVEMFLLVLHFSSPYSSAGWWQPKWTALA